MPTARGIGVAARFANRLYALRGAHNSGVRVRSNIIYSCGAALRPWKRGARIPAAPRPLPAAEIQTAPLANVARLSLATNEAWPRKQAQRQHKEHRKEVRCPQDVRNSPTCACGITASFPDAGKHGFPELIADEHACGNQFF